MKRSTSPAVVFLAACAAVVLLIGYSVAEDRGGDRAAEDRGGSHGMHHMATTAPGTMMCGRAT